MDLKYWEPKNVKKRVLGQNTQILIMMQTGVGVPTPIYLGEFETFSAKSDTTVIKHRPIGYINQGATLQYNGYELSFEGAKVDWNLARCYFLQDESLIFSTKQPTFVISDLTTYGDGTKEHYIYTDVTIFGYDVNKGVDEIKEKLEGFAAKRIIGPLDDTSLKGTNSTVMTALFYTNANPKAIMQGMKSITGGVQNIAGGVQNFFGGFFQPTPPGPVDNCGSFVQIPPPNVQRIVGGQFVDKMEN